MEAKKHILILASWYPNRYNQSNGNFNQAYVRHLSAKYQISVLHVEHRKEVQNIELEYSREDEANVVRVYVPARSGALGKVQNAFLFNEGCKLGLKEVRRHIHSITLVHVMVAWKMGLYANILYKIKGTPYLLTEHSTGYYPEHNAYSSSRKRSLKKIFRNAAVVTAVSNSLLERLNSLFDIKEGKVIPNIVELEKEESSIAVRKNVFVHVSSLNLAQKNPLGIIDAFKEVIDSGKEITLEIIGGNASKDLEKVVEYVEANRLSEKITFLGDLSNKELRQKLPSYEAMIHFSNYESFSIVCAEANSVGLPVIYTACGGPEEFLDATCGIEVVRNSQASLVKAIQDVINRNTTFNRLKIKENFLNKFNNEDTVNAFSEIYEKLS